MWWPMFMLQSALMAAASTIKNPTSPNALKIKEVCYIFFQQCKVSFADDPRFQCK